MIRLPSEIGHVLKGMDTTGMSWSDPEDRYQVVIRLLLDPLPRVQAWLWEHFSRAEVRAMVAERKGRSIPQTRCAELRERLELDEEDLPQRRRPIPWCG